MIESTKCSEFQRGVAVCLVVQIAIISGKRKMFGNRGFREMEKNVRSAAGIQDDSSARQTGI